MPDNAIFNFFINLFIAINRTLLSRSPAIITAVIINFIYRESSRGTFSAVVIFLAITFTILLIVLSSCVGIHANIIIFFLALSSRTVL